MTEEEQTIALHEAGHACMALCLGLPVRLARRWSPDPSRELGSTQFAGLLNDMDREKARKTCLMLLAGPGMADQPMPEWPLSEDKTNDERLLKAFCEYLEMTEAQYYGLEAEMWKTTTTDVFCNLFTAVTGFFEHHPTLDARMLRSAAKIAIDWEEERQ